MTTPDLRRLARFRDGIDRSRAAASAARSRRPAPVAGLAAAIPLPNTDGPVLAARQVRAAAGADCPHCGGGRQLARVGAAPGAGLAGEIEATETNSAVSGLYDSLPAELRTALEDRFEDLAFHVPPEESRGSTCPLSAGAPEACTPYQPPKDVRSDGEAVLATVDSLYGSQVDIDARTCSTRFATLLRVAWTFLVRNADVIEWATCLTHGAAYRRRIVNKLTFSGFGDFRADIHCDDGAGLHGVLTPCTPAGCSSKDIATGACEPFLATSFALFGINICTSTGNVDKWIELFEHGSW